MNNLIAQVDSLEALAYKNTWENINYKVSYQIRTIILWPSPVIQDNLSKCVV